MVPQSTHTLSLVYTHALERTFLKGKLILFSFHFYSHLFSLILLISLAIEILDPMQQCVSAECVLNAVAIEQVMLGLSLNCVIVNHEICHRI